MSSFQHQKLIFLIRIENIFSLIVHLFGITTIIVSKWKLKCTEFSINLTSKVIRSQRLKSKHFKIFILTDVCDILQIIFPRQVKHDKKFLNLLQRKKWGKILPVTFWGKKMSDFYLWNRRTSENSFFQKKLLKTLNM